MAYEDDLKAVAQAYRAERLKEHGDLPAHRAAVAACRQCHQEATRGEAELATTQLIVDAADRWGGWLYGTAGAVGPD